MDFLISAFSRSSNLPNWPSVGSMDTFTTTTTTSVPSSHFISSNSLNNDTSPLNPLSIMNGSLANGLAPLLSTNLASNSPSNSDIGLTMLEGDRMRSKRRSLTTTRGSTIDVEQSPTPPLHSILKKPGRGNRHRSAAEIVSASTDTLTPSGDDISPCITRDPRDYCRVTATSVMAETDVALRLRPTRNSPPFIAGRFDVSYNSTISTESEYASDLDDSSALEDSATSEIFSRLHATRLPRLSEVYQQSITDDHDT